MLDGIKEARALLINSVWTITASQRRQVKNMLEYEGTAKVKARSLLAADNLECFLR
jgi:hypothetical protein